jgi:hypothetical protein
MKYVSYVIVLLMLVRLIGKSTVANEGVLPLSNIRLITDDDSLTSLQQACKALYNMRSISTSMSSNSTMNYLLLYPIFKQLN